MIADTDGWARAYKGLFQISKSTVTGGEESKIKSVLLRDEEDDYRAWILSALVPWARKPLRMTENFSNEFSSSAAASVARNGLKADNKLFKVVKDAVSQIEEIIASKNSFHGYIESDGPPLKRKREQKPISRGAAGMMIRRWGLNWRCSVMFALLVQLMEIETEEGIICKTTAVI